MAKGMKTGGRTAGTPNKLTKELRAVLKNVMHEEIKTLPERLKKLDDKQRTEAVIKLMQFVLPRLDTLNAFSGEPIDTDWNTV